MSLTTASLPSLSLWPYGKFSNLVWWNEGESLHLGFDCICPICKYKLKTELVALPPYWRGVWKTLEKKTPPNDRSREQPPNHWHIIEWEVVQYLQTWEMTHYLISAEVPRMKRLRSLEIGSSRIKARSRTRIVFRYTSWLNKNHPSWKRWMSFWILSFWVLSFSWKSPTVSGKLF